MKVCIIGGGPSGLYLAKYLANNQNDVTIFEKEDELGGNYKYSLIPGNKLEKFYEISKLKNITIKKGVEINRDNFGKIEDKFDVFVLASGGLPIRDSRYIDFLDIVKGYSLCKETRELGSKILIVGMGNVALDISKFLLGYDKFEFCKEMQEISSKVKEVDLCSRKDILESKFSTSEMRELLNIKGINLSLKNSNDIAYVSGNMTLKEKFMFFLKKIFGMLRKKDIRRLKLLDFRENNVEDNKKLTLRFNTSIDELDKVNGQYSVRFNDGEIKIYDSVISSFGFISNNIKLDTSKPVFKIGWCLSPKGNLNDVIFQAKELSEKINKLVSKDK